MGMGYSPMCRLFQEVTSVIVGGLVKHFPGLFTDQDTQLLLNYIDDLFGGAQTEEQANLQLMVVLFIGKVLGLE